MSAILLIIIFGILHLHEHKETLLTINTSVLVSDVSLQHKPRQILTSVKVIPLSCQLGTITLVNIANLC